MIKIYLVGQATGYCQWLQNSYKLVQSPDQADLAIFTGGADICPKLYGDSILDNTYYYLERDLFEISEYFKMKPSLLKVGICRGAQLLTVLNGGFLIQHVNNHSNGRHLIKTREGETMETTSLHHQMMFPFNLDDSDYEILAWSKEKLSNVYLTGTTYHVKSQDILQEPEIVYYPNDNALCIQGHPEMMDKSSTLVTYFNSLVKQYIK